MLRLDNRIQADIDKYVDGPAQEMIKEARDNLLLWTFANHVVQDKVFNKETQKAIADVVGEQTVERLKIFLSNVGVSEVEDEVGQRIKSAREELECMVPASFETIVCEIEKQVISVLNLA